MVDGASVTVPPQVILPYYAEYDDLRVVDSDIQLDGAVVNVGESPMAFFRWDALSTATDDGDTVIRPDDRTSLQAGRWISIISTVVEEAEAARDAAEGYRDEAEAFRDETQGYHDAVVNAVIASIVDTPPAVSFADGLAAVANGEAFYLVIDGRRYYYIRIGATTGDLFAVTQDNQDAQKYLTYAGGGDTESAPLALDVDFFAADALKVPNAVPNRAKGTPTLSLFASNRPSDGGIWDQLGGAGITLTRNQTGLITGNLAVRVQYAGSGTGVAALSMYIPAGRWSLVATVKSASGTPAYRSGIDPGTGLTAHTAPTSATRVVLDTRVFTTAAVHQMGILREAASPAAFDISFDDIYLVPGDGTVVPAQVLGIAPAATALVASGNLVQSGPTASDGKMRMYAPFGGAPTSVSSFSATIAARRSGVTGASYQTLWSFLDTNDSLRYDEDTLTLTYGSASAGTSRQYWESPFPVDEYRVFGFVETGTEFRFYDDGVLVDQFPHTALTPFSAQSIGLFGNRINNTTNFLGEGASFQFKANYIAGDGEMANMAKVARERVVAAGAAFHPPGIAMVFEGDSITASRFTAAGLTRHYPAITVNSYTPVIRSSANFAVPAETFAQIMTRFYTKVIPQCNRLMRAGKQPVVVLHTGANDYPAWASAAAGTAFANTVATNFWDPLMKLGIPVIGSTVMANSDYDGTNIAYRNAANTQFRALAAAGRCAALSDYAANANLNINNPTYFSDNRHPDDAGQALMATILEAVLDPLVALYR